MDAPLEEESPAGPSAGIKATDPGEELRVSDEALSFMTSIEPADLQNIGYTDSLVTVSEGGRELGTFTVSVEFACRDQQPCLLLHAQSQGAIDDCPCGTTVTEGEEASRQDIPRDKYTTWTDKTCGRCDLSYQLVDTYHQVTLLRNAKVSSETCQAYLTSELEVLEEDYHEYVKLEGHILDKRCHMVQRDGQMVIEKVTTAMEEVTKESVSYPMSALRGLVTEGSNLLLMRIFARRKKVPENMILLSLDQGLHIVHTMFSELGVKQLNVGGETAEVFGVERTVHSVEESATTWQSYFLADGHLASRVQVGSPVTMKLLHLPSHQQKGLEKIPLVWEEDMQMCSKFLERKEELMADHASYFRQHPEIRALISDFLQFLLLRKPDDVIQFAREYFLPFGSSPSPEPNLEAP